MPRYARKNISSKFIHLMIQGINKEYIFKDEFEIKMYLKYVREEIKDTDLKIIAYCMMNNHAHFLIYFDNIADVSRLMSHVNTKYANFYNAKNNRCGIVFRNRYKTEEILDQSYLNNCIKYIHNNPVKAGMCKNACDYKYSSYNEYKLEKSIILDWEFIRNHLNQFNISINDILDGEEDDEVKRFIEYDNLEEKRNFNNCLLKKIMKKYNIKNLNEILENKVILRTIILNLYYDYKLTKQEISEILEINRLKIYRIINEFEGVFCNVQKRTF